MAVYYINILPESFLLVTIIGHMSFKGPSLTLFVTWAYACSTVFLAFLVRIHFQCPPTGLKGEYSSSMAQDGMDRTSGLKLAML
jgi:hypothetical protein